MTFEPFMSVMNNFSPIIEDAVIYRLYNEAKQRGSRTYFKLKHNISVDRNWYYVFGPDIDFLEVRQDNVLIGCECKGQRKYKREYDWPQPYAGLDEGLAYLTLPAVVENHEVKFDGGALDEVYVFHACSKPSEIRAVNLKMIDLTPLGYGVVTPDGQVTRLREARSNPLHSADAKRHLLDHLDSLAMFSERGKTFRTMLESLSKLGLAN
jgi:hypothetical protein